MEEEPLKRREFVTLVGSAAVAWPLLAHAEQPKRRISVIMSTAAGDREGQARHAAFVEGLRQLGQTEGRDVHIDTRWPVDDAARSRSAEELVALMPDVLFASGSANVVALQRITSRVPIVFANVIDPVGAGLVASMSRPGGNTTGFSSFDYSLSGKWLELLKEIAPTLTRIAVLRDPALAAGIGQFAVIQAMMPPSLGVELIAIDGRDPNEIERAVTVFARQPNGGLIVTASPAAVIHRDRIISIATRWRLPNVYAYPYYPVSGGLASYGPDPIDEHKRSAAYVDRILRGDKPADLPVQTPTRYELVINLKTAKTLGITVPAMVLARADQVVE
jgi:putative tryptophan/tyrosine transport system substrate-binding protein